MTAALAHDDAEDLAHRPDPVPALSGDSAGSAGASVGDGKISQEMGAGNDGGMHFELVSPEVAAGIEARVVLAVHILAGLPPHQRDWLADHLRLPGVIARTAAAISDRVARIEPDPDRDAAAITTLSAMAKLAPSDLRLVLAYALATNWDRLERIVGRRQGALFMAAVAALGRLAKAGG